MTMSPLPIVSVLIPCHNAARWIGETLESVRLQTGVNVEVVVVDDGSTDGSVTIVEGAGLANLLLVRQAQAGASRARMVATGRSKAPFLQYLDADDVLMPGTLAERVALLDKSSADVAYTDWVPWQLQSDGSFAEGDASTRVLGSRPEIEILVDAWWPPGALLYRRALVERLPPWREDLPIIQDAQFLLEAALHGGRFVHVSSVGVRYRVHGTDSLSRRDPLTFHEDCLRSVSEVHSRWLAEGTLDDERRDALVKCYAYLARAFFKLDRARFRQVVDQLKTLDAGFLPEGPPAFRTLSRVVGYPGAEYVSRWLRPAAHTYATLRDRLRPRP
jgi:glycosyltransferase involved in cell wall biosynthesis